MRAYRIDSPAGLDALQPVDLPEPQPGPGEVVVGMRAWSLNYRDTIIPRGGYPRNQTFPVIPLSDGAGEVVAVGAGVLSLRPGDRVAANFMRDWIAGPVSESVLRSSLGGGIDGVLAERVCLPAQSLVPLPKHLSFAEGATLPCAAVTAWNALTSAGTKCGDTVLLLGTGGVSIFALQFAKAAGAKVILTSSSDEKAAKARTLGADETINYRKHPEWHEEVLRRTGGVGADLVLEVGGPGTLERSLKSIRVGGSIALIGLLDPGQEPPNVLPVMMNAQVVRGIYVGSVAMFRDMNRAIELHQLRPVIDRTFPFAKTREAYEYFSSQQHIGKVVLEL